MYGSGIYGQAKYGSDESGESAGAPIAPELAPPLITSSFAVYAPAVFADRLLNVPLIANPFQVFAPEAVTVRGRPLAEDVRIMSITPHQTASSFHAALGTSLYRNALERERCVLFGANSTCTLYALTPGAGEAPLITLSEYWNARRIPTIESGAIEQWRLEIASSRVNWEMLRNVSTVLIVPDTGEVQRYRVMQTENAMKPGKVYHLRIEAIAQI